MPQGQGSGKSKTRIDASMGAPESDSDFQLWKALCQFVDRTTMFLIIMFSHEMPGANETMEQGHIVVDESVVPGVLFDNGAEGHTGDDDRPFEFVAVVFGGKRVFFLRGAGDRGVEPAL